MHGCVEGGELDTAGFLELVPGFYKRLAGWLGPSRASPSGLAAAEVDQAATTARYTNATVASSPPTSARESRSDEAVRMASGALRHALGPISSPGLGRG